jgi:hypothetical protein
MLITFLSLTAVVWGSASSAETGAFSCSLAFALDARSARSHCAATRIRRAASPAATDSRFHYARHHARTFSSAVRTRSGDSFLRSPYTSCPHHGAAARRPVYRLDVVCAPFVIFFGNSFLSTCGD